MSLPAYLPPESNRTQLAVALAPLLVLAAFTAVVTRLIDPDTALVWLAACAVWVVHEMHEFQKTIDGYNADYVGRHLAWRSPATLSALAADAGLTTATREFVQHYLDAGRVLLRDGQSV
ncbi:MAG: hypothetical protein JNL87_17335 [Burkholderiaceae bacterium]|nr:hypothetical protein [Burkholderiaceae bacterium]